MTTTSPTPLLSESTAAVHLRCVTPDFADSAYRLLKAQQVRPALVVGSLVLVPTDGTPEQVGQIVKTALATQLVHPDGISVVKQTPVHLLALAEQR